METLQTYISLAKVKFHPSMTSSSRKVLTIYYQKQRKCDHLDQARTTMRLLESLIRISQAHARLMWRDKVQLQDAIFAIILMESSSQASSILNIESVMRSNFPDDPDREYEEQEQIILQSLGIIPSSLARDGEEFSSVSNSGGSGNDEFSQFDFDGYNVPN